MSFSLSPPVKIVAALGAVLVVVAGAGSMLLGRGGSSPSSASTAPLISTHVSTHKTTTANGTKTSGSKTTTVKGKHGTTAVHKHVAVTTSPTGKKTATKTVTHTHKHVHRHKVLPSGNLVSADLPAPLQWQLARHHIVVVSLYDPQSDVDSISVAEAHAGATEAGAGFLLVNVLDNAIAGPLTALLPGGGLLPDPGILIYRAPGNVAYRLDGFADRDTVAQAASNAFAGQNGATVTASAAAAVTG
jgi:hypothetical protein